MLNIDDSRDVPGIEIINTDKYETHHLNGIIRVYRNGNIWKDEKETSGDKYLLSLIHAILDLEAECGMH